MRRSPRRTARVRLPDSVSPGMSRRLLTTSSAVARSPTGTARRRRQRGERARSARRWSRPWRPARRRRTRTARRSRSSRRGGSRPCRTSPPRRPPPRPRAARGRRRRRAPSPATPATANDSIAARFTAPGGCRPHPTRRTGPTREPGVVGAAHAVAVVVGEVGADLQGQRHDHRRRRPATRSPSGHAAPRTPCRPAPAPPRPAACGAGRPATHERQPVGGDGAGAAAMAAPSLTRRVRTLPAMARLVVLDADGPGVRRPAPSGPGPRATPCCPLDPRLPGPARDAVLAAARRRRPRGARRRARRRHQRHHRRAEGAWCSPTTRSAASALATSARLGVDPATDRWLACLPLAHVGGLSVVTRALLHRHPAHRPRRASTPPRSWPPRAGGCTLTSLVPTALARIDPRRFRAILARRPGAAAPTAPPTSIATYGLTETGSGVVYDGAAARRRRAAHRRRRRDPRPRADAAARLPRRHRPQGRRRLAPHRRPRRARPTACLARARPPRRPDHHRRRERVARRRRASAAPRTRRWPRSPSSAGPTPSGASASSPSSCPPTAPTRPRSTRSATT